MGAHHQGVHVKLLRVLRLHYFNELLLGLDQRFEIFTVLLVAPKIPWTSDFPRPVVPTNHAGPS
jgi:hypothetical protein